MCLRWAREYCDLPPLRVRILHRLLRCQGPEVEGVYAARAAVATHDADIVHRRTLELVYELIAVGADRQRLDAGTSTTSRLPESVAAR